MRRIFVSFLFAFAASMALAAPSPDLHEPKPNLTILVDEALMLPTTHIARAYAPESSTPLTIVWKNAAEAESQIEQGLEAHVLLTANHALVERLANHGLIDVSATKSFARTQLALVAPTDIDKKDLFAKHVSFAAMLNVTPEMPVYIAPADTDEGARASALMQGFEFSAALAARSAVRESRMDVLDAIRENHGLGLLLAVDALNEPDVTIASVLPDTISPPVTYEAVVLASESMKDARAFVNFLNSRRAENIFAHFGFQPPAEK